MSLGAGNGQSRRQITILCEGFDDRSFWRGWLLERMGCSDPTGGGRRRAVDEYFSYSYLAKGYAQFGADDFVSAIRHDGAVADQLERRLQASSPWLRLAHFIDPSHETRSLGFDP